MKDDRPSGTALFTALARAAERRRGEGERILDDPFAGAVVQAAGLPALDEASTVLHDLADRATMGLAAFCVARHRTIDEWLLAALEKGTRQVVNLGSGYDSRAWRLAPKLQDVRWLEVDHPATLGRKRELFARAVEGAAPCAGYQDVAVDFEKDDLLARLCARGFERAKPTFFIWEGVTYYLERATVEATFATLSRGSGRGSVVAFDLWDPAGGVSPLDIYRRALLKVSPRVLAEPLKTSFRRADLAATLGRLGLLLEDWLDARALGERTGAQGRAIYPDLPVAKARRVDLPGEA